MALEVFLEEEMRKMYALLSLVVVASMLLAACGHASTPAPQPIQPKPQPTFLPVDYGEISVSSVMDRLRYIGDTFEVESLPREESDDVLPSSS